MNDVGDLELNILSCILIQPSLMKKIRLEDKHFRKHQRQWQFMKAVYQKFHSLDIQIMYAVCKNKYHLVEYLQEILMIEPTADNFDKYQDLLLEQFEETKKNNWIKQEIYVLANNLYVGNVKVDEFQDKVKEIYHNAEEIYKKV